MKILIVNASDIVGGAARAAYRLHTSLLHRGLDSRMLVQFKSSGDHTVTATGNKFREKLAPFRPVLDSIPVRFYKNRTRTLFSPSWLPFSDIVAQINRLNPDIVHLHWICDGMMRIGDLARIKAPVVWSLHDMWAMTGGCHYDEGCQGYGEGCGTCHVLGSRKENDLSRRMLQRKSRVFSRMPNLTVIGLSRWLQRCARHSSAFAGKDVRNLPNPIDTNLFKPIDKHVACELWNLPKDKKLVLFGAMGTTSDKRKGFRELCEALGKLASPDVELVVFGSSKPRNPHDFGFATHYLGHLHDEVSLATLYSAIDVMVVPSLQENLSNVIMEALSCSTPVVGFDVGGNCDLVDHKVNGYLAEPFDTADLAHGIDWVLNGPHATDPCSNARGKVLRNFDQGVVAERYEELYAGILKGAAQSAGSQRGATAGKQQ